MRGELRIKAALGVLLVFGWAASVSADVRLPGVFGEHMVLQRDTAVPVWGWAEPGEKVTVTLGQQSKTATACAAGKWAVKLDALKAGGPYTLKVQGKNTIEIADVLVGEVWLCSGQSNMEMSVGSSANFKEEQFAAEAKSAGKEPPPKPKGPPGPGPGREANLFNGMIAPLVPYAFRGAIWYQGESNAGGGAKLYGLQLTTLIQNWRSEFGHDFPFLYVQLPNFQAPQTQPSQTDGWVIVREQMLKTLALPGTGMAGTIDIGEAGDIHPKNKQDVGKRLALWALSAVYGKDVVRSGPLYKAMSKQDGKNALEFDYVDGGLTAKGEGPLEGFAIAGADQKFVWAEAKIEGQRVVVSNMGGE